MLLRAAPVAAVALTRLRHFLEMSSKAPINKPNLFGATKQSGLDLEKEPRSSGRGVAFFLTFLFIELIDP